MRFSLHDEAHIPLCPIHLGWLARRRAYARGSRVRHLERHGVAHRPGTDRERGADSSAFTFRSLLVLLVRCPPLRYSRRSDPRRVHWSPSMSCRSRFEPRSGPRSFDSPRTSGGSPYLDDPTVRGRNLAAMAEAEGDTSTSRCSRIGTRRSASGRSASPKGRSRRTVPRCCSCASTTPVGARWPRDCSPNTPRVR